MSVLATVLIAIAAAVIGFFIGCVVGISYSEPICPVSTEPKNPIKTFNATEDECGQFVLSKVVLPKRINELEYNKRVNAALKDVVDKAVNVWVGGDNKPYKRSLANHLFHEWHTRIVNVNYRDYNPKMQCLNFIGRHGWYGFVFDAFWESKDPKNI